MWLNPQAGKMKRILHSDRLPKRARLGPYIIPSSLFGHIINLLLTETKARSIKKQKELSQYPDSRLVNNAYLADKLSRES